MLILTSLVPNIVEFSTIVKFHVWTMPFWHCWRAMRLNVWYSCQLTIYHIEVQGWRPSYCPKVVYVLNFWSQYLFFLTVPIYSPLQGLLGLSGNTSSGMGRSIAWQCNPNLKCLWNEKFFVLIWKAFQNTEEWRFSFWNIFFVLEILTFLSYFFCKKNTS